MQVELLFREFVSPGIAFSVEERPEDGERWHANEQNRGQSDNERILAPLTSASLVLIRLVRTAALSVTSKQN